MAPETPRGVSSRLLTMKFMQRAAASATTSNGSPESDTHSAKKRKLGHGSPAGGRVDLNIDQAAIQAALDDREAKRQAALDKHAGGGETRWVLKDTWTNSSKAASAVKSTMNVVYVGYGEMGSDDGDSSDWEDSVANGRTATSKFQKGPKKETFKTEDAASGSDDSSDDDSDAASDGETTGRKRKLSSDDAQSGRSRSRSRSRSRQHKELAKAKEFRDKRKKKEVNLGKITSISSGGGNSFSPSGSKAMVCYRCQQPGHRAVDCTKSGGRSKR